MLENESTETPAESQAESTPADNTPAAADSAAEETPAPAKKAAARKSPAKKAAAKKTTTRKSAAKKTAAAQSPEAAADTPVTDAPVDTAPEADAPEAPVEATAKTPKKKAEKKAPKKKAPARSAKAKAEAAPEGDAPVDSSTGESEAPAVLFQVPESAAAENSDTEQAPAKKTSRKRTSKKAAAAKEESDSPAQDTTDDSADHTKSDAEGDSNSEANSDTDTDPGTDTDSDSGEGTGRRRRRRGGRRRRGRGNSDSGEANEGGDNESDDSEGAGDGSSDDNDSGDGESSSRRRRQRQRKPRNPEDEITSVQGSTRLEAKKQRRREGREAGRRRAPIVSEAEFLARRESVDRVMVIRQRDDLTQIGVLEDKVLVEHYVSRQSQTSLIGNVYLGRVQNVLPSMEAAFIDIGKGRNAVLYAGEVNWSALGHKDGQPRKIESVLTSGQTVLVQVTKDPVGHKGARLSGQVSLPGRFLVYVPDGNTSGISRKLPDTERNRLKTLLKQIVPDSAGVIVRTAAEGASEEELTRDVERLTARWNDIEEKVKNGKGPELLYGEPDLTLKVVRDLFTEDFAKLVVQGDDAWDLVEGYVSHVAPDLKERLERFEPTDNQADIFAAYRVDEQIAKGLGRKVWLPSGGSLIIDRTEAMTVVDVNTGKFTGSGGNLEETVTKNNLEAAEEIVRQLRLRDIGGIIVIDFIDMVLESNRDLVLRRLVECLGRDRTRHQVAEVTSLGLVQMTRKRIGTGLLEAFGEECTHCKGRGTIVHDHPIDSDGAVIEDEPRRGRGRGGNNNGNGGNSRGGRGRGGNGNGGNNGAGNNSGSQNSDQNGPPKPPSPADLAASKPKQPEDEVAETLTEAPTELPTETSAEATAEPTTESTGESAVDTPAEAPAETSAPTVVTSTRRRRTARRPAGPPASATETAPEPAPEATQEPTAPTPAAESEAAPEAAEAPAETPAESPADQGADEPVLHVPVKRKGTRKR